MILPYRELQQAIKLRQCLRLKLAQSYNCRDVSRFLPAPDLNENILRLEGEFCCFSRPRCTTFASILMLSRQTRHSLRARPRSRLFGKGRRPISLDESRGFLEICQKVKNKYVLTFEPPTDSVKAVVEKARCHKLKKHSDFQSKGNESANEF